MTPCAPSADLAVLVLAPFDDGVERREVFRARPAGTEAITRVQRHWLRLQALEGAEHRST